MPASQPRPPAACPGRPGQDRRKITSRKVIAPGRDPAEADDSVAAWAQRYLDQAVRGVRSEEVAGKIGRHLERFAGLLVTRLRHDRVSAVTPREGTAWRDHLAAEGHIGPKGTASALAPATRHDRLAHLAVL